MNCTTGDKPCVVIGNENRRGVGSEVTGISER